MISFIPLPSWIKAAARCGFAIHPVLVEAGVVVDTLNLGQVVLSFEQSRRLMQACVARARNEHFPFVLGETFAFDAVPELETFMATSATLRETFRVFDWIQPRLSPLLKVTLHEQADLAYVRIQVGDAATASPITDAFVETTMAALVRSYRMLLPEFEVEFLALQHVLPAHAQACASYFGAPVRTNQSHNAVVMRRRMLELPLHGAFAPLHQHAQSRIEERLIKQAVSMGTIGLLERLFLGQAELLSSGLEECAAALDLRPRALQRRLQDEGQSFVEVQARARYHLACELLSQTQVDIERISERLGFADRRAFTRAFCRWAGCSPSAYRLKSA